MDPLSITASSIAIITICAQVTSIFTRWMSNVRNIDDTINGLTKEVEILCTVLAAVNETFERPGIGNIIALNAEAQLWPCITGILDSCQGTLRKLRKTLHEVETEKENSSLVQRSAKHVRLGNRKELITSLLSQIHSHHEMLQMLLQCTNICVTIHESMHNRAADVTILRELSTIRSEIHHLKDASRSSTASQSLNKEQPSQSIIDDQLNMRHGLEPGLENTMQSLEDFVEDSVSTVYARSASGSEVSWTWSDHVSCGDNDVQLKVPSASGQFKLEYLQNPDRTISAEDQAAKDIDFSFDEASGEDYMSLRELLAGLKTLDELQIHRLAMQASRHRANNLLKRLIMIYGHDIVAPQGFDELNSTPLLWATCNGHRSTMKLLLRNGANIDHRDNKGISPLLLALIAGKEDAALLLMQRGANTTDLLQSGYHYHLLNIAAMHNCVKVMAHVFLKGATEASTSFEGSTALHGAVIAGSLEAATFLLDYGFNIEARDHGAGWTPLMFACSGMIDDYANGRIWTWSVLSKPTTLIKLLLQRGADINAVGRDKMTPLRVAIHFKKFDVLRLLLEYGVKQDIKSRLWLVAHAKDLGVEVEKQERAVKYFRR